MTARVNPDTRSFSRVLRSGMTDAERALWRQLRLRHRRGAKFRRQHLVGGYIVDFVCFERKLVIELDGSQHADRQPHDAERTRWLESQGFRVLRFPNGAFWADQPGVIYRIARALGLPVVSRDLEVAPLPDPPHEGEGGG